MVGCAGAGITTTVNVFVGEQAVPGRGVAMTVYVPTVLNVKEAVELFSTVPTEGEVVQSTLNGLKFCVAEKLPVPPAHTVSLPAMVKSSSTWMFRMPSPVHSSTSFVM